MIMPIISYGSKILKQKSKDITIDYPNLKDLIDDMFETMYAANGVGLAAPQIGLGIRLFIVDGSPFSDDDVSMQDFRKVFINPQIIEESGNKWSFNEGCLSIPSIREDVSRFSNIRIVYKDSEFNNRDEYYDGTKARIIQHEYDHIEGLLFTDHLSVIKKRLLKSKLNEISRGKVNVSYRMKFSHKKSR
ncbi:peptide deformylase [Flavobacteriales bacterium]|nr:peptide deformylase [Flavobacteriales bacterium]